MRRRDVLCLLGALPLAMGTASAVAHADVDLQALNEDIARHHAAPGYDGFAHATGALRDTLAGLRDGVVSISDARGAFWNSMDSWMGVQHLRLGPSQLDAREFRIEYWPDKRNRVDRQLSEALQQERPELLEAEGIAGTSVAIQGFPALERLLFVDPVSPGTYGAAFAASVGANLAAIAGELSAAWQPGSPFMTALLEPGSSDAAYADAAQVSGHLLTALATQLEFVAQRKLMGPLGATPQEARPRLAESWRSARSLRNAWINASAMESFFGAGSQSRFAAVLQQAGDEETAQEAGGRMIAAAETLSMMPEDLFDHVEDAELRNDVLNAAIWLDEARRMIVTTGAPALGLNLGFNSLDGD